MLFIYSENIIFFIECSNISDLSCNGANENVKIKTK